MNEDEMRDMELRAAWEDAQRAAQARMSPPTPTPADLPDAPPEPAPFGPPPAAAPSFAGAKATGGADEEQTVGGFPVGASSPVSAAPKTPEAIQQAARSWGGEVPPPKPPAEEQEDLGGGGGSGGSAGIFIPGGMAPHTEKREAKYGKQVAPGVREAIGEAGRLQMDAAGLEQSAANDMAAQQHQMAMAKVAANETAAAQQQRLGEDRDRMVQARLAEIETLNQKAQGKPEDLWSAPHVFGRLTGFLMLALGTVSTMAGGKSGAAAGIPLAMGGKFVNGLINQDIQAKLDERAQAGKAAGRQINLLHLHEQRMGDQSKAIEATKLAYYDNILQQMEAFKSNPDYAGRINESNFNQLQAQILKQQAETANGLGKQEQADVTDELVNKMRDPKMIGGGPAGPRLHDVGNTITLSDKTSWELGDSPGAQKARERIVAMQKLMAVNDQIKQLRRDTYALNPIPGTDSYDQYHQNIAQLQTLGSQKAPLMSMALDGSTIRKDEREEIERHDVKATEGLGLSDHAIGKLSPAWLQAQRHAADAVLDRQNRLWTDNQKKEVSVDGREVKRGYVRDEHGELSPVARYMGRNRHPDEHLAPNGFRPDDPKQQVSTRGPSLHETTEPAPDFGFQSAASAATGKKKKKAQ